MREWGSEGVGDCGIVELWNSGIEGVREWGSEGVGEWRIMELWNYGIVG